MASQPSPGRAEEMAEYSSVTERTCCELTWSRTSFSSSPAWSAGESARSSVMWIPAGLCAGTIPMQGDWRSLSMEELLRGTLGGHGEKAIQIDGTREISTTTSAPLIAAMEVARESHLRDRTRSWNPTRGNRFLCAA